MKRKNGFTLVELIVSIGLISLIGTIAIINLVGVSKKQENKEIKRNNSIVIAATEAYIHIEDIEVGEEKKIAIQDLIDKEYLKAKSFDYLKDGYVKVTRSTDRAYVYEIIAK